MRLVTDIFAFCAAELPRWNSISISGYHMREAGATAAQELAFTLADAIAYVEGALARGLDVDGFAGRLSFFFAAWSELFEEVAKFRAARRMWARIMRDRFGARDPRSMMCRFHVQTAGSSLTAQSIDNNVVRTTIQALAAVLGGTQSLHTNARDEALALPTAESARLALRTQQILAHEAGVTETPDPLAGSWFVERLTDQLEAAAQAYLDEIEAMGGAIAAIEAGYQQRHIQDAAYRVQREVEAGERVVVGVNRFTDDESVRPPLLRIDPALEREQVARLRAAAGGAGCGRLGGRAGPPRAGRARHGQRRAGHHRRGQGAAPRWARSAIACATCGASIARSSPSDGGAERIGCERYAARAHVQPGPPRGRRRARHRGRPGLLPGHARPARRARPAHRLGQGRHRLPDRRGVEDRARRSPPTPAPAWRASWSRRGRASTTSASRPPTWTPPSPTWRPRGVEVIDAQARRGAEGPVAFLHPRSCHGVLVELIEAPGGPAWSRLGYDAAAPLA